MLRRQAFQLGVAGAVALTLAASAYAYVCHPDPPGTRSLAVKGQVDSYSLRGWRVTLRAWVGGCERRIVWRPVRGTSSASGCTDRVPATTPARLASDGRYRVSLVSGSRDPDQPVRQMQFRIRNRLREQHAHQPEAFGRYEGLLCLPRRVHGPVYPGRPSVIDQLSRQIGPFLPFSDR